MLKAPTEKKLKLGFYPYTYVRTIVMRSLLFKREDYQKMLKMSFAEIAKFLQESHYKKDIDGLATSHSGADLIELALNRNLAASFAKLRSISSPEIRVMIDMYSKRRDIEDIKTIIRGKYTESDEKLIHNSITAAGTMKMEFLISLSKKDSIEQILRQSKMLDGNELKHIIRNLDSSKSLALIENSLDKQYYMDLLRFASILPKEGQLFKNFLLQEVEILNLLTILRLKKNGAKNASEYIILSEDHTKDQKVLALAKLESLDEVSKALSKTEYRDVVKHGLEEYKKTSSLIKLETGLYHQLLKKSINLLHLHLLSIDVILGYMFAKEIEIRNLRMIVKGKQLGLSEEFIEDQLIME